NANGNGYDSFLEIGIQGNGTVGLGHVEKETAKIFDLKQNYPNPYHDTTTIPFSLFTPSEVSLSMWDLEGKKVKVLLDNQMMSEGNHEVNITENVFPLLSRSFIYELVAKNEKGIFKSSKMMTGFK